VPDGYAPTVLDTEERDEAEPETLTALFRQRHPAETGTMLLEMPGSVRLTYGEADRASARIAHALVAVGVRPGDRVAVQVEKSPQAILVYLACIRTGAVLLSMNPAYSDAEVDYLIEDAEPSVVVCDPSRAAAVRGRPVLTADGTGDGTLVALGAGQSDEFDDVEPSPDDLAAILYTSGTTGRPKGAMLSHRNLASNAVALHRAWGFRPDDVLLHALPVFHTHGLFVATNCVLANGTGMVFLPRFEVDAVIAQLPSSTVFMGVPTYYTRLLGDPRLSAPLCRNVRLFVSGSAPLLANVHAEFKARTGHVILERYGMTETGMIASNPLEGERRPGTVGPALLGVSVRLRDPDTGHVGPDGIGQIEVRGPNVFGGYWRRPELSASEFTEDGFFRTGDLGRLDQDGYLAIVGRSKDLIISGGLNVYPKEVEEALDRIDGVLESAVIGVPDPDLGERVVAVVVPATGRTVDEATIRAEARRRLASFKVPKRVHLVDALPRNAMSKIEKGVLRDRFAE
jgi:malonyl-CoA/methylmalonyl-CoA synthetase